MQICRELAGFSFGRADLMRRAMSKKKADVMQKEREHFIWGRKRPDGSVECPGCVANGIPAEVASDIFDEMSSFASYAFNKSHAAAYALVSYQTAWLKCHYPKEYMAALLTSVLDNTPKLVAYIGECERLGIRVLPPDVNRSMEEFTSTGEGIRFGLLAIRNLGRGIVRRLIECREGQGEFACFYDFCSRMYDADLRRRALESLIRSGALDCFGMTRRSLIESSEAALADIERRQKANLAGQINLFDCMPAEARDAERFEVAPCGEYEQSQLLKMEKDALGLYVSGHPLAAYRALLAKLSVVTAAEILAAAEQGSRQICDGAQIQMAAVISAKKLVVTKRGDTMAYLTAEDLTGSIEVLVFPRILEQYAALTGADLPVLLSGRLSFREDEAPKLRLESVTLLDGLGDAAQQADVQSQGGSAGGSRRPGLYLRVGDGQDAGWENAKKTMAVFDGATPVYVYFPQSRRLKLAPRSMWVQVCDVLLQELRRELGENNVALVQ